MDARRRSGKISGVDSSRTSRFSEPPENYRSSSMRKALFAVSAAAVILVSAVGAGRAAGMPRRHHHHYYYTYQRQYISHRYECCGFPDGYGYNPGPYWGLGGYLNSW